MTMYLYTVAVRTHKGRTLVNDYVSKSNVTITDEEIIKPEEKYRLKIKVTGDEYEISTIEEGLSQIDTVEVESCQFIED